MFTSKWHDLLPGIGSEFNGVSWREPYLIKDPTDGQFYAFICACPSDAPTDAGGTVADATSLTLEDWQTQLYHSFVHISRILLSGGSPSHLARVTQLLRLLYLLFSPYWNRFFERRTPKGTYYNIRSCPIKDRGQVSYDRLPWE